MFDYNVFPQQRQELIREILSKKGKVVCAELAEQLKVSEHTIRRDLQELSQQGVCKKVYGGAVSKLAQENKFNERKDINSEEKEYIALKCIELLKLRSCIFLDASTTNLILAQNLPSVFAGTIVTNSPEIAMTLTKLSHCEIILLGGVLNHEIGGCIGIIAIQQIQEIIFDQVFLGGCAMDPDEGLTSFDYADCQFKKNVLQRGSQVIAPLTLDKISRVARYVVAQCEEIDVIVVPKKLNKELEQRFNEQGVMIIHADKD